ncbi:signal peptide containing protein [Theileria equi strain WA]|uniref:Signal peptide containing protein n=1 Tax=Theileria equi strain WA TaxID=1537102 RepID=L1LGB3_THEEQ|nr:signal peptide containing protein [Theileria equi strain WA]EKX74401.1 signal peptide containing protein [Theileria equi strain WA]|eukprot:XP_004833853.1 signal peptide containing protein [Theileria equi strain WA]
MIFAKFAFTLLFSLATFSFAAELELRKLQESTETDLGLHVALETSHEIVVVWFKPFVGKEITKVIGDSHELWKAQKEGHELNELIVLAKVDVAAFAVISELTEQGGLLHHYLELDPKGGVRKEYTDFPAFLRLILTSLHRLGAVEALKPPYPDVPSHFLLRHLKIAGEKAAAQVSHDAPDAPAH